MTFDLPRPLVLILALVALSLTAAAPAPTVDGSETPAGVAGWARAVGGANRDFGTAVAAEADGRVFLGGHFQGGTTDHRGRQILSKGSSDIFLAELDATGRLTTLRTLGGRGGEEIKAMAVGSDGELYVVGFFSGKVDFDLGAGVVEIESAGSADAFVLRLEKDGSFGWVRALGGPLGDVALGLSPRPGGGVLVAGYFQGRADFDPGVGEKILESAGRTDAFVAALDGAGGFLWAESFGGEGDEEATGAVATPDGALFFGRFEGRAAFRGPKGDPALTSSGDSDAFVAGLDGTGRPRWSRRVGGAGKDVARAGAAVSGGGVVVVGTFLEEATTDGGSPVKSAGRNDIFLLLVGADGAARAFQRLGGPGDDFSFAVAAGGGAFYLAGISQDVPHAEVQRGPGPTGSFVARIDPVTLVELDRRSLTSSHGVQILGLALGADGSPLAAGTFQGGASVELGGGEKASIQATGKKTDAFVTRLAPAGPAAAAPADLVPVP
jgi:outer membrane protein assembly factor BamB